MTVQTFSLNEILGLGNLRTIAYDSNGEPCDSYNNHGAANIAADLGLDPKRWEIFDCRLISNPSRSIGYGFGGVNRQQQIRDELKKQMKDAPRLLTTKRANNYPSDSQGKVKLSTAKVVHIEFRQVVQRDNYYNHYYSRSQIDPFTCYAIIELNGNQVAIRGSFEFFEEAFGAKIHEGLEIECGDYKGPMLTSGIKTIIDAMRGNVYRGDDYYRSKGGDFDYDSQGVMEVCGLLGVQNSDDAVAIVIKSLLSEGIEPQKLKPTGCVKIYKTLESLGEELLREHPIEGMCFRSIMYSTKRTINSVKISSLVNDVFKDVDSVESLKEAMQPFVEKRKETGRWNWFEDCISNYDAYKDKRRAVLAKQTDRAFSKLMEEYDSLELDEKKHPKLTAAIKAGDIPVSTFFRKTEQYFLLNDNWELWEKMLKLDYETTVRLAQEVSRRTTYEKDLMSYFYFILYDLPSYLKKHTGEKWTCSPKLIESESELNPPVEDDSGVARTRSALTPSVDNKERHVVVPYASLAIPGRQTTYCYSHSYHVLRKGLMFNGNVCMADTENKLNGRDDYGLMFYTLTGSMQGRGYPTFLIIFERHTSGDTTVHFHRTHPSRSKDGDYNPIHNWIKVCYNWMAGNVRAEKIKAQQGDLFFVEVEDDSKIEFSRKVTDYDKHRFERSVPFAEYEKKAKANILGYVQLEKNMFLTHSEHDDERIPAGTFEIRQCRSWEANPKGVWTLNID
tara:strand:- start:6726 stop:8915 length:2190 start_codon:yes stop_codon:yes gene_type:complete